MHPNEHCNCRYADVGCDRMEQVMDQISGKWKMRILFMVGAHGTLRYGELRKLLDGVTHKMLSTSWKGWPRTGWCSASTTTRSARVEYRLTENGEALMPILTTFKTISAARAAATAASRKHTTPAVNNIR